MNNDTHPLEPDISLPLQDRIDILFHEIELAVRWDRPSILFAIYKSDIIRDEVNSTLKEKLEQISQKPHFIKANINHQFDFLDQVSQLPDLAHTVLFIDGFNWECGPEGAPVFTEFNKNREYFVDNNIRAIFWLYEKEVSEFATNATECWVLRHRMVEFVDLPPLDQESIQPLESLWQQSENSPSDQQSIENSPEEKPSLPADKKDDTARASAFLNLGILFWRKGNFKRALKYVHAAEELSQSLADQSLQSQSQNALALVQNELGNVDEAISAFQRAITLSPESAFLWNNLGQLLAKNERNDEAIGAFNKALSCSSKDFLSWNGLGQLYLKSGVFQNAVGGFEKALEIAPYYEPAWVGIGKAYLESGELDKAEASLRKAVEINAHSVDAWKNLGTCISRQKRDNDAIAVFRKALEFNPQVADFWDEVGRLLLQRLNYAESITAFQKVISLDPQNSEASIRLAHALFQIGDYETSASIYEGSIQLFEDNVTRSAIYNRLGDAYLYMKDYEKAIGAYKQSEQLVKELKDSDQKVTGLAEDIQIADILNDQTNEQDNPVQERGEEMIEANNVYDLKTAAEWNEQGNAQLKAGAYNEAIVAYTKAIELAPEACWPYIQNLAQVHYEKGKARGKLMAGKTEDPDVWEGDDAADSAPFTGYDSIINPADGENDEPRLDKSKVIPAAQPLPVPEAGSPNPNESSVPENSSKDEEINAVEPQKQASVGMEKKTCGSCISPQKEGEETPSTGIAAPPLHVENPPLTSSDWNELGNSYTNSKKFNNAIEAYKKSIEMDPKFGQPYSNLGFVYYRLGKYDFAVLLFKKSIDLLENQEDKAISWNRLGDSYRRLGDYGNALAAYKKSSETVPPVKPVVARARATILENIVAG